MSSFETLTEAEQTELLEHYARIAEILEFTREDAATFERLVRENGSERGGEGDE
jgi:hypothetical protein